MGGKCVLYSILDYIKYQSMICSLFWVNTNSAFWYMWSVLPLPDIILLKMSFYIICVVLYTVLTGNDLVFLYTPGACVRQKFNYW